MSLSADGAKGFGALGTGADRAEVIIAVDSGGVAVGEADLDGVVAHGGGGLRAGLGFEHRQRSRGCGARAGELALLFAIIVAGSARAFVAKISEVVVAGVTVGPGDVDTRAGSDVNFHGGGFFPGIDGNGHVARSWGPLFLG
jgi:hypothetical protein